MSRKNAKVHTPKGCTHPDDRTQSSLTRVCSVSRKNAKVHTPKGCTHPDDRTQSSLTHPRAGGRDKTKLTCELHPAKMLQYKAHADAIRQNRQHRHGLGWEIKCCLASEKAYLFPPKQVKETQQHVSTCTAVGLFFLATERGVFGES